MKTLQPTLTLVVDEIPFEVSKMSADVQRLVEFYDDWRVQEQSAISELNLVQGALRDLQGQLSALVQREIAEAAQAVAPAADPEPEQIVAAKPRSKRRA